MKKENIYGYIFALAIYLRLILEKKNALKSNFSEFIRGNLHNIYGEDRDLLVYHVILLICLYVAFYTVSIRMISLEIDNFRNIVCFKSKGIFQLYKRTICFFSKKLLFDSCSMMIVISIGYMFIKDDYIYLLKSFRKPDIFNAEKILVENIVEIFAKKFNGSVLLMSHNIFKERKTIKNHPNYKIHFYLKNETEEYYGWGYEIPMEEAEEVEKKIKEF